jgi:hypothetical protein
MRNALPGKKKKQKKSLFLTQNAEFDPIYKWILIKPPGVIQSAFFFKNPGAFFAAQPSRVWAAKNRAIRFNSSQTASRFAPGFPLLSLARFCVRREIFSVSAVLKDPIAGLSRQDML